MVSRRGCVCGQLTRRRLFKNAVCGAIETVVPEFDRMQLLQDVCQAFLENESVTENMIFGLRFSFLIYSVASVAKMELVRGPSTCRELLLIV